ncbi:glycosyl transferase family 1 [Rhodobacter xanthinilyticus]|uniref:Glycosyl transferase family 1 n=1 Tax=Rhodobacter xanthinilyticus TaxID=1850250 RepID=A0A1D9M8C2_9RHOB|nr:glycosyltransferase [Rhodobacter xanthinilyticus]AOZ68097.1 glycosyl transferase family 1 [Rhodobacter xanthinilyticus]
MTDRVYLVLAVFRPNRDFLAAQLASIAAQDHRDHRLVAVISDRVSADLVRALCAEVGLADPHIHVPGETLDAVRGFEAGLAEALFLARKEGAEDALFALCDQDDIWHPNRLSRGVAELRASGADLVHSDARLVDGAGAVIAPSMFAFEKRARAPGLRGLLYRNNITGMTVLMRRRVVEIALPFPQQSGVHFYHDLWLGLVAAALGGVRLIPEPLVDYRQHGANTIGAVDRSDAARPRLFKRLRGLNGMWLRREAASYALARYLAQSVDGRLAEVSAAGELAHGEAHLAPLRPYLARRRGGLSFLRDAISLAARGKFGLARIALGFGTVHVGRLVWALRISLTRGMTEALEAFDERLYSLSPGVAPRHPSLEGGPSSKPVKFETLTDLRKRPRWTPEFTAPAPSFTVLVPTLNPTEIFAGILTAIDIGVGLAERGYRVTFIATDLPISSQGASRSFVLRRLSPAAGLEVADRIALHCGVQSETIPAHPGDLFLATAWWTAHVAQELIARHGFTARRFHYLIQDYEPNFYAWGPEYADAVASYALPFEPIYNTSLLRDFMAEKGYRLGTQAPLCFHPAIEIARYATGARPPRRGPRRLALYGRPEVPRNMYAMAIEVLARFIEAENLGPEDIELISVGLRHAPVSLPNGLTLASHGKLPWEEYPGFLRGLDLGLSLMYSPHPSHPPIEMAASGVRVVTNSFGPKDLSTLSPAIVSATPDADELTAALRRAWAMAPVEEAERAIDLKALGLPPDEMIDLLADRLAADLPRQNG